MSFQTHLHDVTYFVFVRMCALALLKLSMEAVYAVTFQTGDILWQSGTDVQVPYRVATHPEFPGMSQICAMLSRVSARPARGCQMSRISRCSQNDNDNNRQLVNLVSVCF